MDNQQFNNVLEEQSRDYNKYMNAQLKINCTQQFLNDFNKFCNEKNYNKSALLRNLIKLYMLGEIKF